MPADPGFEPALRSLGEPALDWVAARLDEIAELAGGERQALLTGATASIIGAIGGRVSRLLMLELNAAGIADGPGQHADNWTEFIERSSKLAYWTALEEHYPTLLRRVAALVSGRAAAAVELGRRFAGDREQLGLLVGEPEPELVEVRIDESESHSGGRSVATLTLRQRRVVYQPRPLAVEAALRTFLDRLFGERPDPDRIRVPAVLAAGRYGWSEIPPRAPCRTPVELRGYYVRVGHWLALARLFGTPGRLTDDLLGCGPTPVLVDCATLFSPVSANSPLTPAGHPSPVSAASDAPAADRQPADLSARRARLAQQPAADDLAGPPFDEPPELELAGHWPQVLSGFEELTDRLRALDRAGRLADALAGFGDVEIRAVLRGAEVYAEVEQLLWHPTSLRDETAAIERACQLLADHGAAHPPAPDDLAVVAAEVADLLEGDTPYFRTEAGNGRLRGPRNTSWGEPGDLVAEALHRWRTADPIAERALLWPYSV
ncbi:MAG: DUF4135 domain-containing protein [Jatrophihabitantaceae bacterium]